MRWLSLMLMMVLSSIVTFAQGDYNQQDKSGQKHGKWLKRYDNGNVRYQGTFEHGKEVGKFEFFDATKTKHPVATKTYFKAHDSVQVSYYKTNGLLESQGMMLNKKRVGQWAYYFDDGKTIFSTESYADGQLDGEVIIYYTNGQPVEIKYYKQGQLHGQKKVFNQAGKEMEVLTYKNGVLDGLAIYYDKTGSEYAKGQYAKGLKTGVWSVKINGQWVETDNPNNLIKSRTLAEQKKS